MVDRSPPATWPPPSRGWDTLTPRRADRGPADRSDLHLHAQLATARAQAEAANNARHVAEARIADPRPNPRLLPCDHEA